ncbi:YncE family protein [Ulvibacterium marinum]|uniref:YncE family protein n=1 Tax=Ulvibacterium marinum TaxID=2419782 RepID=UPI0024942945|nr:YncE family protein [Ulvibacterium marinum]
MKKFLYILILTLLLASCKEKQRGTDTTIIESNTVDNNTNSSVVYVGKGPDALFLTPDKSFLYVANVEDTLISVIDTQTDKVLKNIEGIRYPWGFAQLAESNLLAASGYDKQVVIIDSDNHTILKEKLFETHIGGITANKKGDLIYVIAIDDNKVFQLDATTLNILKTFSTGKGPDGIGISGNDSRLFVTNTEDGSISVIDIATGQQSILKTGGKPELIHSNKDHSLLYISNFFGNRIHIIDTKNGEIVKEIENIKTPEEAVLSEDGNLLYVVSFDLSEVYVYDAFTLEKKLISYETGNKPIGLMPVGNKLYVSNYGDNSISIINK